MSEPMMDGKVRRAKWNEQASRRDDGQTKQPGNMEMKTVLFEYIKLNWGH